jgi:hypothetical protein
VTITNPNAPTNPPGIAKMIEEMKDLKLYLLQGQSSRAKNPMTNNYKNRTQYNRSVQFVTCHNCQRKGHMAKDYPEHERGKPSPSTNNIDSISVKLEEVNLLECTKAKVIEAILEVMVAK